MQENPQQTNPEVSSTPVATPQAVPTVKKGIPKVAKIIIGVIAGLLLLGVIGIAALFFLVNAVAQPPLDASNKFFNALQANQPTEAYALTSADFKKSITAERVGTLFNQVSAQMTGEEEVTAKKVESVNGVNQAAFVYTVENNGKTRYARIVLKESDSKWEVNGFKTSASKIEAVIE